jgi:DNA-binding MarR family transcriptional regulator
LGKENRIDERKKSMAVARLSRLQKRLLAWLHRDYQRTQGRTSSSHHELVQAVPGDKGNISHRLGTLEAQGLLTIGRSPGGKAEYIVLTEVGLHRAAQSAGKSLDKGERKLTSNGPVE